jgi:hypothetical protein
MSETSESLRQYLLPAETILWEGRSGRKAGGSAALLGIPVVVAGALIVLFQTLLLSGFYLPSSSLATMLLLLLPIFMFALFFMAGPRDERYVVTSRSILIGSRTWTGKFQVTAIPLRTLPQITVRPNTGGTGTLVFGSGPTSGVNTDSSSRFGLPTFWKIEQPWDVYQLIRKQMDEFNSR